MGFIGTGRSVVDSSTYGTMMKQVWPFYGLWLEENILLKVYFLKMGLQVLVNVSLFDYAVNNEKVFYVFLTECMHESSSFRYVARLVLYANG
jgi:predicted neutral ceramidase superfamily lipid hydrolase